VEPAERRALLTALAATTEPPVLGCSPAGIGKTTTLVQWTAKETAIGPGGAYAGGR
jgi:ATP/maltotriose-dependent transcriptional regulator MalT